MGSCTCHPEIDTPYLCMKHQVYLCEECLTCRDPELFCKFRPSCPVWFLDKEQKRAAAKMQTPSSPDIPGTNYHRKQADRPGV